MRRNLYKLILSLRNRHLLAIDVIFLCLTPALALVLRLDDLEGLARYGAPLLLYTLLSIIWKIAIFHSFRLYSRYWRLASVEDVAVLGVSTLCAGVVGAIVTIGILRPVGILPGLPRSVAIIDAVLTMMVVGGMRLNLRLAYYFYSGSALHGKVKRALIVGAGSAGSMVVKELRLNPHLGVLPVGFLDDDPYKKGIRINGIPVIGRLSDLPDVVKKYAVGEVVIAMPRVGGNIVRKVVRDCKTVGVPSKTVPGVFEILQGSARISEMRDVQIDDLLRRGIVETNTEGIGAMLRGARVMITGAGGSIGSELCRQVSRFGPEELVLLGHGENSIFQIAMELHKTYKNDLTPHIHTVVADMRDKERMNLILQLHRPQVIYHAAAHKHVGLMEVNVSDCVTNNVMGTMTMLDLAVEHGVDRFVMISTDKAVCPSSIMGVTKRVAELLVLDTAQRTGKAFVNVRFGNVLGSRGSVVPIFQRQIAEGGPVFVTHPDASRFFLTIPEAVQLVLQASAMGKKGELFVLDMGKPIRIQDLARDMIRLSGLEEGKDIEIQFTGLKKGEKLQEALFFPTEAFERSAHEKIFVHKPNGSKENGGSTSGVYSSAVLRRKAQLLIDKAQKGSFVEVQALLKEIVPEYKPGEETAPGVHELQAAVGARVILGGER